MSNFKIRELKKEDAGDVEKIYDLYWSGEFRKHLSERLKDFLNHSDDSIEQGFNYFIAEKDKEIVGIAAFRKLPERMKKYVKTDKPAEFYVLAVKYKNQGIGKALRAERIEKAKKLGFTEAIFFSGEKHKDAWISHDKSGFKRIGAEVAPDGEAGQIWQMIF
jgi:L-amino acid N-acyltransferase YncA